MNPRVLEIPGSVIRRIASMKRRGTIDLGLGEPSFKPNMTHFRAAMEYVRERGVRYTENAGDPELREAIARCYNYRNLHAAANVCVTTGSQEAMYVTLKTLLDPAKDELLVVEPAFPSYVKMAKLEGIPVRTVAMVEEEDFAFDAELIAAAIGPRTRAIVICSPSNPTGRVISRAQAAGLVRALENRTGEPIWLIHDEVYREQCFVEDAAELAAVYDRTIVTNSLSKSNALTGLRIGWILGPAEFVAEATKAHAWLTSCADTFAQMVALSIFGTAGGLREHTAWYRERQACVTSALRASGLRFLDVEGSFYAAVRLPDGADSERSAIDMLETKDVLAIPGSAFGDSFEGWLRLSWVTDLATIRTGVARIAEYCATAPNGSRPRT
jgi:aminotransferase